MRVRSRDEAGMLDWAAYSVWGWNVEMGMGNGLEWGMGNGLEWGMRNGEWGITKSRDWSTTGAVAPSPPSSLHDSITRSPAPPPSAHRPLLWGHFSSRSRNSNVPTPWIVCGPSKYSIVVRSGIFRSMYSSR